MNLEPRPHYSTAEKHAFYASAAKRFKAELKLRGATAAIHLENKNDEVFWGKVLHEAYPQGRFRFISASRSIGGNVTCGCTQCLQYRDFLDKQFWIAIDSDYRYLQEEHDIDALHFILQTYTYSFENHFCYWRNCQRAVAAIDPEEAGQTPAVAVATPASKAEGASSKEETSPTTTEGAKDAEASEASAVEFDWKVFLESYSRIVYPLLVWQLYLAGIDSDAFPKSVFHRLLSLPIGPKSLENNGASLLHVLKDRCRKLLTHLKNTYPDADTTWYEARCSAQGVHRDNCYLFVRGHQLYDLVVVQGHKLNRRFEKELCKELCFDEYDEIRKIHKDIELILKMPNN